MAFSSSSSRSRPSPFTTTSIPALNTDNYSGGGGGRRRPGSLNSSSSGPSKSAATHSGATASSGQDDSTDLTEQDVQQVQRGVLESDTELPQIFLSVMWHGGHLGAAYYDEESAQIYLLRDVVERDSFTLTKQLYNQLQPVTVIASAKSDERFLEALQNLRKSGGGPGDSSSNQRSGYDMSGFGMSSSDQLNESNSSAAAVDVQLLPSIDYSLAVCKQRVLGIHLPSIPDHFSMDERTLHFTALVPFDATCTVRALGGLLKFLEKRIDLDTADGKPPVLSIKIFSLDDLVQMDENSYHALQIFQKESHPSTYKTCGSGAKEGLSLFGIMNRTKSVIGSKLLRVWFMRPSCDIDMLRKRQEAVSFFASSRNSEITANLHDCLKSIKNMPRILKQMKQAQASVGDWQALYKTVHSACSIGDLCRAQHVDIDIFKKISAAFSEDLFHIASLILKIVDFEDSFAQNRFAVKPNVDPSLDQKKRTYNSLPTLMTEVAREELKRLPSDIEECSVIYLPQLGYLLTVPCVPGMTDHKDFSIPGLEFVFLSNNQVHYKSPGTQAMDVKLGDTLFTIIDVETQIMHKLQNAILERSQVLFSVMDLAAELDCLIALAIAAKEQNYVCPELTKDSMLEVTGGRHPLQELCVTPFVPNDTLSGGEHSRMKFLTGPNASGKSVYLKQVGMIAFLAHIGSFVPAESATIGMMDGIYTRIHTQESVSVGLSTFMIDLNQMGVALNNATSKSLVLLDEFGKGTNDVDGQSLLVGCLRYWLNKGDECPHAVVSSHFHAVVQQNLLPDNSQLTYQTMEVLQNGEETVFLYQLKEGHASCSQACHVASLAGLPEEIVARGKLVSQLLKENKPISRADSRGYDSELKRHEQIVEQFLTFDLDSCDDLQKKLGKDILQSTNKEV
ncbi:mutS protein homolog 5-like [Amphiura filiformis]|uniref:mutS protein homolog 5-like n=1 Tax=Amphiura filiformis TaxID=82378 RepID=UPI003B2153ED